MDNLDHPTRTRAMRAVRSTDTSPEMTVRRLLYANGYRYRLHCPDLPGKPDLVFASRRKVIFIHGCFWHQHRCRRGRRMPKSNQDYWKTKLRRNVERDRATRRRLGRQGWRVLTVWECQISRWPVERLKQKLWQFLDG